MKNWDTPDPKCFKDKSTGNSIKTRQIGKYRVICSTRTGLSQITGLQPAGQERSVERPAGLHGNVPAGRTSFLPPSNLPEKHTHTRTHTLSAGSFNALALPAEGQGSYTQPGPSVTNLPCSTWGWGALSLQLWRASLSRESCRHSFLGTSSPPSLSSQGIG